MRNSPRRLVQLEKILRSPVSKYCATDAIPDVTAFSATVKSNSSFLYKSIKTLPSAWLFPLEAGSIAPGIHFPLLLIAEAWTAGSTPPV